MVTRISPALAAANWVSAHSAQFGDQMPIRSPLLKAEREQPGGQRVGPCLQLGEGPANALLRRDHRLDVAPALGGFVQRFADGVFPERRRLRAFDVTELGVHHDLLPQATLVHRRAGLNSAGDFAALKLQRWNHGRHRKHGRAGRFGAVQLDGAVILAAERPFVFSVLSVAKESQRGGARRGPRWLFGHEDLR